MIAHLALKAILMDVRSFAKAVAMLLLAFWLPVTMHCTLENLPVFSFLQTCCDEDAQPAAPHDCHADFCGDVESGSYRMEDNSTALPAIAWLLVNAVWVQVSEPPTSPALDPDQPEASPPELSRYWQFFQRTALPPRAPSILS